MIFAYFTIMLITGSIGHPEPTEGLKMMDHEATGQQDWS